MEKGLMPKVAELLGKYFGNSAKDKFTACKGCKLLNKEANMWQERFEEMQEKVDKFLIGYKQDFDIDKKPLAKLRKILICGCCAKPAHSLLI